MTSKRETYLIYILFGAMFFALIVIGVLPQTRELKQDSGELTFQRRALTLFEERLRDLESFQKEQKKFQPTLARIKNSLVNPEAPIRFIKFLKEEAQLTNLEIKISPGLVFPSDADLGRKVGFQVTVGGEFSNCLRFLERIESGPWLVEIFGLNIKRVGEKEGVRGFKNLSVGEVSFTFSLQVFSGENPKKEK